MNASRCWATAILLLLSLAGAVVGDSYECSFFAGLLYPAQTIGRYVLATDGDTSSLQPHTALAHGSYKIIMQEDCNLVLCRLNFEKLWQSGTKDQGTNCFMQLQGDGNLAVLDGTYPFKTLWSSGTGRGFDHGPYQLILWENGEIGVYFISHNQPKEPELVRIWPAASNT